MKRIKDYIGETTEYDKKIILEERRPKSWLKNVSAFANGKGGVLLFGVADDDTLVGLTDVKSVSEKISETIKVKMDPIPQVNLEIHEEEGKQFIILRIASGIETPYYYVSEGSRIAYIRVGNESIPASAIELKRLVMRGSNITYDSLASPHPYEKYAFTKLRSVYRQRTGQELAKEDFISFGLMNEEGMLTNAGALLADESPIRHSRLFCTRWYGLDKASGIMEALDDKEYSGSLVSLLQNGEEFIKNNTKKRWKKTGNGRIEMPDIPERAALECLVNGLIHRDYLELGSEVHIDIYDDRMEIYSPGGMYDGSLVQNLDTNHVPSMRRNPIIADIFNRMNYMERRGSGFKKIKDAYHAETNYRPEVEPKFYSDNSSFWVTLYNLNYKVPVEKVAVKNENVLIGSEKVAIRDKKVAIEKNKVVFEEKLNTTNFTKKTKNKIFSLFNKYGVESIIGRSDIVQVTGDSLTAAGNLINKMKEAGIIESVIGHGKGKYRFKV